MKLCICADKTAPRDWQTKLQSKGIKVTLHHGAFGSSVYLTKSNGEGFGYTQRVDQPCPLEIEKPTATQQMIVNHLINLGLATTLPSWAKVS